MNSQPLPKQVYYDMQLTNFESVGSASQRLQFSETRNQPIIRDSGAYELSIVRFELDTYSLPTWIASIEPDQPDPNKMIDSVTLQFIPSSGEPVVSSQTHLVWAPTNLHISQPGAPAPLQDSTTEYYWANSFRHYRFGQYSLGHNHGRDQNRSRQSSERIYRTLYRMGRNPAMRECMRTGLVLRR